MLCFESVASQRSRLAGRTTALSMWTIWHMRATRSCSKLRRTSEIEGYSIDSVPWNGRLSGNLSSGYCWGGVPDWYMRCRMPMPTIQTGPRAKFQLLTIRHEMVRHLRYRCAQTGFLGRAALHATHESVCIETTGTGRACDRPAHGTPGLAGLTGLYGTQDSETGLVDSISHWPATTKTRARKSRHAGLQRRTLGGVGQVR